MMNHNHYSDEFYASQVGGSWRSAEIYINHLHTIWSPKSVVDVGCGRGTWLAAWAKRGITRLLGIDGNWNSKEQMLDPRIQFVATDLDQRINMDSHFDLAMSLEVGEHLKPEVSENFVESISKLADAVLFSAAYVGQGGENHINTRPHSFWAELFFARGYSLFDVFRPVFWSDELVEPWYRQNAFLYVKMKHPLFEALTAFGYAPADDSRFIDCVHPWLYELALQEIATLRRLLSSTSA